MRRWLRNAGSWLGRHADRWGVGRLVLAAVGVLALLEGGIIAWRADAATTLLIVGAILAALGLFNWTELQARWRDWSLSLLLASEKIHEVVEREALSADARAELTEVATTVGAIGATGPAMAGPSAGPHSGKRPFHRYIADRHVVLGVSASAMNRYRCVVTQPDGTAVSAQVRPLGTSPMSLVEATFPHDFPEATQHPVDGRYGVDWYAKLAFSIGKLPPAWTHEAHDEFQLPPSPADTLGLS